MNKQRVAAPNFTGITMMGHAGGTLEGFVNADHIKVVVPEGDGFRVYFIDGTDWFVVKVDIQSGEPA